MHQENRKAGKGEGREQRPSAEMEKILGELFDVPSKARTPRQERPDVTGFEFPWRLVGRVVPGLAVAGGLCWIGWMLLVGIERAKLIGEICIIIRPHVFGVGAEVRAPRRDRRGCLRGPHAR